MWLLLALGTDPAAAGEPGRSLAEMAAEADLIAVVRVEQTDYQKTRDFPSLGTAFLKILIPYKGTSRDEIIEVSEKGLADDACYYPEPGVWQFEGDRFLAFLKKSADGKDSYRGRAPGCRMPVLVTEDNRYAVRYPIRGLEIKDPGVVTQLKYADPAAFVNAADFTSAQIDELVNYYHARRVEEEDPLAPPRIIYVYTLGIPISRMRALMFPDEIVTQGTQ